MISVRSSNVYKDLMLCLLKHLRCSVTTTPETWYRVLNIILNRRSRYFDAGNPLKDLSEEEFLASTDVLLKIQIFHLLCEWMLEESKAIRAVVNDKNVDPLLLVS